MIRFYVSLVVYTASLIGLLVLVQPWIEQPIIHLTADMSASTLWLLGVDGRAFDNLVTSNIFMAYIVLECTAVYPIIIFLGAIFAYPASLRSMLVGIAWGVPAIVLVNLVRIVSLFHIGWRYPHQFEFIHLYVWQTLVVLFSLLCWIIWINRNAMRHHQA